MVATMQLTDDEILTIYAQGPAAVLALVETLLTRVATQEQTIAALTARVRDLEDQLNRTSRNSHQPPANDGFKKQSRSLRQRSGKKPGGQPGHVGHTLTLTDTPDAVQVYRPAHCAGCG